MFKKVLLFVAVFALVLVVGAIPALADGDENGSSDETVCPHVYSEDYDMWVPGYCDGRINAFDIAQPVAIFYDYVTVEAANDDGETYLTDVVADVQLWGINAEGDGYLALTVPASDLNAAFDAGQDVQFVSEYGFTLNYNAAGHILWVAAPNGYSFAWDAW